MMENEDVNVKYAVPHYAPENEPLLGHKLTASLVRHLLEQGPETGLIVGSLRAVIIVAKAVNLEKRHIRIMLDRLWDETQVSTVPVGEAG